MVTVAIRAAPGPVLHRVVFSSSFALRSVCCAVTLDMMQACALLLFLFPVQVSLLHTELSVPQNVLLEKDLVSQTLSLTWESDSSVFDVEIFRTELGELVLNETVLARVYARTRRWSWSWRSEVPLQCTSHSVHIRARDQHTVSQWSRLLTISGLDLPEKAEAQMYPQDTVVTVGSNVTFCCILPEGQAGEGHIRYMNKELKVTMLSHRTIATSVDNLPASHPTGTNVICSMPANSVLTGAVVFVGYPPGDEGLQCETRDLVSAECYWNKGQDTHLRKTSYQTQYTLNGRRCVEAGRDRKQCRFDQWQDTWTLMAVNPLGTVWLNDSAKLIERVHLVAPVNILAVPQMRNATLQWTWSAQRYKTLDMICQVHLTNRGRTHAYNYTGVGLSSVILEGLIPDAQYSVSVCCASLHNFWRWGDFSSPYSVRTKMDRPEAPDVWVRMDSEDTGRVLWKPLSGSASHGPLLGYEVYLKAGEEVGWKSLFLSSNASSSLISLSNSSRNVIVAVAARNPVGLSKRSAIPIPKFQADFPLHGSELVGGGVDLELSWPPWPNASHGYVLEWAPTCCTGLCSVQWVKVPNSNTSTIVQSGSLVEGVRYTFSVFALSHGATVLLQRQHGYGEELVPAQPVGALSAQQSGSSVLLSWDPIPMCNQTGFVRGYTIYPTSASNLRVAQLSDPALTSYSMEPVAPGSYKFTVKACTSAGEGSGATVTIRMESDTDMLVVEILVALGVMSCILIIISIFCYKKREWVKKAFYPEIPGPKLTGDWITPAGPMDVKPPRHSLVHIVESPEWESRKGSLVSAPEEEDDDSANQNIDMDTDSDEPAHLRYYNQLVSDGSHSNHASDSSGASTSSEDSAQTQVTYTGIQSPAPSQGTPSYAYRPQMQPTVGPDIPGAGLDSEPQEESSNVGYKPQCSWQVDSPEAENFSGSLGSPTSVTSSQFLIPESSEENLEPSGSWFQNLLSGKF
ncbi:LIF receptor subunit alpha a isoform X1 [Electrophorus electricus]|uniref:LIF receptor subunit alpha a isoform X1 n=2 Tax=Electrophorus electricus TaxID=8005 RepID=UPI0015D0303A|nr:LIF receptor subunit alpha a isoform X1 [Electrophorus electricus]XP_035381773.1 LIF receptor subunit alpha a isoform X1 [Electrophorus electricus]